MNQIQIKYFLELTKYLNFTKASESLYIAQPALSRSISKLEKELGFLLFNRDKKTVSLTPAGIIMRDGLKKIAAEYNEIFELAKYTSKHEDNSLNVSILECQDTNYYLFDVVQYFSEKFPYVDIHIHTGTFKQLREDLTNNKTDIIITQLFDLNSKEKNNFNIEYLSSVNVGCIVSNKSPLASLDKISIEDLKNETLVVIDKSVSIQGHEYAIDFFKKRNLEIKSIITAKTLQEISFKVEAGFGIALWDSNLNINSFNTKFLELSGKNSVTTLIGVWKKENFNNSISLFFDFLRNI